MSEGYGVEEAARYANTFNYNDNRVKEWLLVFNESVTEDIKIGRYHSTSDLNSIEESYLEKQQTNKNLLENEEKIENISENAIFFKLEEISSQFNRENYELTKRSCNIINLANSNEMKTIQYIDAIFKIGDFYTDYGYTIEIIDNKIIGIYDNNIDIEKQKNVLENSEKFNKELYKNKVNNFETNIIVNNACIDEDNDIKYYYDIVNDKKYILVTVKSDIVDMNGKLDTMYDTIKYEL